MKIPGFSPKLSAAVSAGLMFFIISSPIVYRLVDQLIGGLLGPIASPSGCPTTWGLIVHSAVFAAAAYYGISL
jgi:uncharacterized membrane protein (DUF106 family)